MDETKQEVLRADVVVVEHPGFFLSQDDNPAGPVGEPFEHDTHVLAARPHAPHPTDARVRAETKGGECAESEPLGVDTRPAWGASLRSCRRAARPGYNEPGWAHLRWAEGGLR
ncbi:hypothetical protein Prum_101050 [Phytohabitans rumicis]|uniref:Uncharacterized protein n=1 Tax=Phytohabitans rumicis TaxID=1076125 RepID=A0A6V8LGT6_9ACTN|nr:hypothetical protein Prum_101050 [Phytohabitans rumicis]